MRYNNAGEAFADLVGKIINLLLGGLLGMASIYLWGHHWHFGACVCAYWFLTGAVAAGAQTVEEK